VFHSGSATCAATSSLAEVLRLVEDWEHAAKAADHALKLYRQRGDKGHEQPVMTS
jgi:hypothetical protein